MFLPVGMALWPTDKQGPEGPEQEAENVTGKAEEKKASWCLAMAMAEIGGVEGFLCGSS